MASRTSILETIPLVIANPPKLKPKSTIGRFESALFFGRSFFITHPFLSLTLLTITVAVAAFVGRRRILRRGTYSHGGILGNANGGGFFNLDNKEGLLGGSLTGGKVD